MRRRFGSFSVCYKAHVLRVGVNFGYNNAKSIQGANLMKIVKISLSVIVFIQIFTTIAYAQNEPRQITVENYIESINKGNWSAIPNLWVKGSREEMIQFFTTRKMKKRKSELLIYCNCHRGKQTKNNHNTPCSNSVYHC